MTASQLRGTVYQRVRLWANRRPDDHRTLYVWAIGG